MNARSRRQALLFINEHLGEEVHVAVELDIGFGYTGVLGADGTLTEWRHGGRLTLGRPVIARGALLESSSRRTIGRR